MAHNTNTKVKEELLEIPSNLLKSETGFSFDIGGSCVKLVYCLGEKGKGGDTIVVRMASFSTPQLKEAITFLKERLGDIIKNGQTIYTTGVGCHIDLDFIQSSLNITMKNVSEMDCFVEAFRFLVSHFSIDQITHPQSSVETGYRDLLVGQLHAMLMKQMSMAQDLGRVDGQFGVENADSNEATARKAAESDAVVKKPEESKQTAADSSNPAAEQSTNKFQYPCIIAMIGSGGGIIKVEENSFSVMDGITRGGRMFLGLGSMLVGVKSFDELIELASKGDDEKLTLLGKHVKSNDAQADVYGMMPDDLVLYCFGHTVGRDIADFKKEDLVAGLLASIAQDTAQATHLNAHVLQADKVFFCGSFVGQSQLVRDTIGKYFTFRTSLDAFSKRPHKSHFFLKFGGYLGALGCLIRNMNK